MSPDSDSDGGLQFDRVHPTTAGAPLELLPLKPDAPTYRATYRTAEAIVQPTPGELRIPSIRRETPGDFRRFMDALTGAVGRRTIRFLGVQHPDDPGGFAAAWDAVTPEDSRPLYEAVHGFAFETIDYEHPDGTVEPCKTLVGEWDP